MSISTYDVYTESMIQTAPVPQLRRHSSTTVLRPSTPQQPIARTRRKRAAIVFRDTEMSPSPEAEPKQLTHTPPTFRPLYRTLSEERRWSVQWDEIEMLNQVGRGTYGEVWRARLRCAISLVPSGYLSFCLYIYLFI